MVLRKIASVIIAFLFFQGPVVKAQDYIYISKEGVRNILRVNMGLTQWSITQKDSASRLAMGIHLSNEVKIFSAFSKREHRFAVHDAFYFDINLGLMRNQPHTTGLSDKMESETKFSARTNFGYLGMAGYRNEKWAVLAGIDFRWTRSSVGDISMPDLYGPLLYYSRPIVFRGEYCISKNISDKRIIAMMWYDKGNGKRIPYKSFRLELPLGKNGRWWFLTQYTYQSALSQDNFLNLPPVSSAFKQWTIGVRVGNLP